MVVLQLGSTVTPDPESISEAPELDSESSLATAAFSLGTGVDLCCLNLPNIVVG